MRKTELVNMLAKEADVSQVLAKEVLEKLFALTSKTLKKEGRFSLPNIGILEVVKRARRKARNPRTGEIVMVKAHKAVKFKPSKTLKDFVR